LSIAAQRLWGRDLFMNVTCSAFWLAALSMLAGSAHAQYRLADETYWCYGLRKLDQGGGANLPGTWVPDVKIGRLIMDASSISYCDYPIVGATNANTKPLAQLIVDLGNRIIALEAKATSLAAANTQLVSDLEAWKSQTLAETLKLINTLPFATQPSVVQALTPLLAEALRKDSSFIGEVSKAVKAP
jgi:hypothetical protein